MLQLLDSSRRGPVPFRFKSMWLEHEDFEKFVEVKWRSYNLSGTAMGVLTSKLRLLKKDLRVWNSSIFGNVHVAVDKANNILEDIQLKIANEGYSEDLYNQEIKAHSALAKALNYQAAFFKEKSHLKWLENGDRNSSFFHRIASNKKKANSISMLQINGSPCTDPHLIDNHLVEFFRNLFNGASSASERDFSIIPQVIPKLVDKYDNSLLTGMPSGDDIKATVFSMDSSSAPGPDGFGGVFYQSCWNIVGDNVISAVQEFFRTGSILKNLNSNFLILIPKSESANSPDKFRPIVLGNFIFEVITKILADRLNVIAGRIISPNQFGFIRGRRIQDCISLASEAFNCLDGFNASRNFAIQMDIAKAFDTMDWRFILKVLKSFGFSDTFCSWISNIFQSANISVLVNGSPSGFFSCSRGVRQGDPLSPLLFNIAEDFLSRYLTELYNSGALSLCAAGRNMISPSHLLYADDILLFCQASVSNLKTIKFAFDLYGQLAGQVLSIEKSKIYWGKGVSAVMKRRYNSIWPLKHGSTPFTYLGVPIFKGKPKKAHLLPLSDKIKAKIGCWNGKLLSMAGRLTLIKSVISGAFIHSFFIYKWPSAVLKELNSCIRNFLWTGSMFEKKIVTVSWRKCCKGISIGGLGFRDLITANKTFLKKRAWDILSTTSWASSFLKQRFLTNGWDQKKMGPYFFYSSSVKTGPV